LREATQIGVDEKMDDKYILTHLLEKHAKLLGGFSGDLLEYSDIVIVTKEITKFMSKIVSI
jgi:hypothetical protein